MIHYQLRCRDDHEFEGWFRDSTSFDQQAAAGLLSCPRCGSADVARALMAPSVQSSRSRAASLPTRLAEQAASGAEAARLQAPGQPAGSQGRGSWGQGGQGQGSQGERSQGEGAPRGSARQAAAQQTGGQQAAMLPDQMRAALQRLRAEVEQHCDNVGEQFAQAARERHRAPPDPSKPLRGIYGQATEPEREALAEEGIEIVRIPWLPRADS